MENKNKNKKRLLILVALVGVMGIGGVVAATSISINGGVPISLGAGYSTATTCDSAVTITAGQGYDSASNLYQVTSLNVADVDVYGAECANKTMQLAVVTTNGTVQTTWSLPSSGTPYIFVFGGSGTANTVVSNNYYASTNLSAFDIATLSTVALSIS
jgi:hypothetical protein